MIARAFRLCLLLALALGGFAHAASGNPGSSAVDAKTAERQIRVMLRVPPTHYRPAWVGSSASGGYRFAGGRSPNTVVLTLSRSF